MDGGSYVETKTSRVDIGKLILVLGGIMLKSNNAEEILVRSKCKT